MSSLQEVKKNFSEVATVVSHFQSLQGKVFELEENVAKMVAERDEGLKERETRKWWPVRNLPRRL